MIRVTVVLATPTVQEVVAVELPGGGSPLEAVARSGLAAAYALPLAGLGFAVYGRRVGAQAKLADGDRLEITRALDADPKDARRLRAVRRRGIL